MKLLTSEIILEEDRLWDRKILRSSFNLRRAQYRWFFQLVDIKLQIEDKLFNTPGLYPNHNETTNF